MVYWWRLHFLKQRRSKNAFKALITNLFVIINCINIKQYERIRNTRLGQHHRWYISIFVFCLHPHYLPSKLDILDRRYRHRLAPRYRRGVPAQYSARSHCLAHFDHPRYLYLGAIVANPLWSWYLVGSRSCRPWWNLLRSMVGLCGCPQLAWRQHQPWLQPHSMKLQSHA